MNELVSVVITTYNRINELRRAIKSVIQQSYKNIEIIVVDDNVDNSISKQVKSIIEEFNDERIVLKRNEKNLGGALSRNVGIQAAKGNYIAFLDDDDEYLPTKVEKQLKLFKESNDNKLALVYCYCNAVLNGKVIRKYNYDYVGNCLYNAMRICIAATSQWMCKKECLIDVGMFSDVPCKQDSTVIIKLLAKGYNVDRVPETLSLYHEENIPRISSKNPQKRIKGENLLLDLCRKNYDKIDEIQRKEVEYCFSCTLVYYYYEIGDYENYRKNINNIIKTHSLSMKTMKVHYYMLKKRIKKLFVNLHNIIKDKR